MSSFRNLCDDLLVEPGCLAELEVADILAIVEDRASIGAGEIDRTVDDGLQHHLEIERRAHCAPDFAQGGRSRLRACTSSNSRVFSIAITA